MLQMRSRLRAATDTVHMELHHHAVLKCLTEPQITARQYEAALGVFYLSYRTIETARACQGYWSEFSLAQAVDTLQRDLPPGRTPQSVQPFSGSALYMLGALYVAHGASFGRASFRKNVMNALPRHPHHFLNLPMPAVLWKDLLSTMELESALSQNARDIEAGARDAFGCVAEVADHSLAMGGSVDAAHLRLN